MKTKDSWVDVAVTPEEQGTEDWLSHDVKDTVESSLGIRVNDVSALRKIPGDRIEEPQEDGPNTTN